MCWPYSKVGVSETIVGPRVSSPLPPTYINGALQFKYVGVVCVFFFLVSMRRPMRPRCATRSLAPTPWASRISGLFHLAPTSLCMSHAPIPFHFVFFFFWGVGSPTKFPSGYVDTVESSKQTGPDRRADITHSGHSQTDLHISKSDDAGMLRSPKRPLTCCPH